MGMSTHVIGFRPPDEKWRKMKAVWDACADAGTSPPKEVSEFFQWTTPDPRGVEVDLRACSTKFNDDSRDGIEIDVNKLPKDVTIIRFYNAF
jgi:hypothetical protein